MGLGTVIKTENEEVKGGGTWSKAAIQIGIMQKWTQDEKICRRE